MNIGRSVKCLIVFFNGAVTEFRQEFCHRIYEFADQDLSNFVFNKQIVLLD